MHPSNSTTSRPHEVQLIESRKLILVGHVTRMEQIKISYSVLFEKKKTKGTRTLRSPRINGCIILKQIQNIGETVSCVILANHNVMRQASGKSNKISGSLKEEESI